MEQTSNYVDITVLNRALCYSLAQTQYLCFHTQVKLSIKHLNIGSSLSRGSISELSHIKMRVYCAYLIIDRVFINC